MRNAISPREQLAVTLRFLVTGGTYTSLQYQFRINKGTICQIIPRVCEAISETLSYEYIKCPTMGRYCPGIWRKWQLPNRLGTIDGKHVRILHPPGSGSDYFNYKGLFSIVLLAIVRAKSEFIYSRTSGKRPPKMSSLGGGLWEVVAYESLDHNSSKLFLIRIL